VQGGKALEKRITVGDRSADWVEVLSGLEADEPVVLEPGNLQHGQPVTVVD
jgi:multidrug efflux pump subunit AcrA (membrane-fusion protein)